MYLRRILLTSFVAISQLVYAAPAPAQNVARADGSLKLKSANADKLTFEYSTSSANGKNWIGLYHVTGGPDDEKKHEQSLRWEYVTKGSGSVEIATPVRGAGQYKAYFLANDGYKWLANPIPVEWKKDSSIEFKVMSYNLWYGGKKVNGNHDKQVSFLKESGADIIGFQEADGPNGGHDGKRLAEALGWNYHQPSSGDTAAIISRYQIVARHKKAMDRSNGVALSIAGGSKVMNFWSVHTTADDYGPYELCFNKANAAEALKKETATKRNREIGDALNNAKSQIDDAANKPFIFVGDFNAPSHLDWVASTKSKHCGYEFAWPTSKKCTDMKLIDSFRVAHPDPAKDPGDTWSPIEHHNPDVNKDEPQDRIDFIYHKGGLKVVKSETKVVGKNNKDKPNHADNEWTSDHAALITTYQLE